MEHTEELVLNIEDLVIHYGAALLAARRKRS